MHRLDRPLIGIVSRLTGQKGADLIAEIAPALFQEDCYLVVLDRASLLSKRCSVICGIRIRAKSASSLGYNDALAHRIEAGADIFLMPSRYEPCGLNQIYSLRYGTVPVVRATGGLDDTIDEETGFKFRDYSPVCALRCHPELPTSVERPGALAGMMRAGMARDFSWMASAVQYDSLYRRLLNP